MGRSRRTCFLLKFPAKIWGIRYWCRSICTARHFFLLAAVFLVFSLGASNAGRLMIWCPIPITKVFSGRDGATIGIIPPLPLTPKLIPIAPNKVSLRSLNSFESSVFTAHAMPKVSATYRRANFGESIPFSGVDGKGCSVESQPKPFFPSAVLSSVANISVSVSNSSYWMTAVAFGWPLIRSINLARSKCRGLTSFVTVAKYWDKDSASCDAASASSLARPADSFATSTLPNDSLALLTAAVALSSAIPDLSIADWAFWSAFSALSLRDPMSCPDSELVLTRQTSSNASAAIRSNVERLASLPCASFIPPVNQVVKSATYSPAHATATNVAKAYSAYSQQESVLERDATSEAVRVIASQCSAKRLCK